MILRAFLLSGLVLAGAMPALSQSTEDEIAVEILTDIQTGVIEDELNSEIITETKTENGQGVVLRALDLLTGDVQDLSANTGESLEYGFLQINVDECRYPKGSINSDAYVKLLIMDKRNSSPKFNGWMVASSPAISALEHPRYDVWVISCSTSDE